MSASFAFADSHVHLADEAFAGDVDAVIARACADGVQALVCIGESPAAARRAQALAARYPETVFHTCGVHPHDASAWDEVRDTEAIRQAVAAGAVAIGECGLDSHYDHAPPAQQREVLRAHLALAAELHRPIVLHTRDAEADTVSMLAEASAAGVRGVLHCFTGSHTLAEAGLEAGWCVSFSGIVTFKNWTRDDVIRAIPDDRLLVESDAPYLAPVPHRGRRNESAWVAITVGRIATVRGASAAAIARTTLANTIRFFNLPSAPESTA